MGDHTLDVDAYLATLDKPTIKLRGETYTCEYPTFNERLRLEAELGDVNWEDAEDARDAVGVLADFFDVPKDVLMELPEAALTEVTVFFLAITRGASLEAEVGPAPAESTTGSES